MDTTLEHHTGVLLTHQKYLLLTPRTLDTTDLKDTTKMVFTIDTTQEVKTIGLFHLMTPQIYCIYLRLKV